MQSLQRIVEQLDHDPSLLAPDQLRRRLDALDLLDAYLPENVELLGRAGTVRARLEDVNDDLYAGIREDIQRGDGRDALLRWAETEAMPGMGYDHLDDLISGVFRFEQPEAATAPREPEMVFYQPTPARPHL